LFRNFNGILIVTCDHITSCEKKAHVHGPVPILIYGKGKDKVKSFDEFSVKKGKLGLMTGKKLWRYVLKA
jgi:2,3-bisphosphoglycerate-independent phosphoglycerate mutase